MTSSVNNYQSEERDGRYGEYIYNDCVFSSDNLDDVIKAAISDYENGEACGEDIEIYDDVEDRVIWSIDGQEDDDTLYHEVYDNNDEVVE